MFSRLTLPIQQSTKIKNSHRNFAWFTRQTVKSTFGRRLKNLVIISIVGLGTFHSYRGYRRYQWFNEMSHSDENIDTKPRIVVLGTGWGALPFLKHIDTQKYEVICVSPRNYFLMTPLLPSVSVGTVETRTVVESIRSIIGPRIKFVEANCVNINPETKIITCNTNVSPTDDDKSTFIPSKNEGGASSRVIKDSARVRPVFDMKYDILIVAIGSENNTFNTPGVEQHAHPLKEVLDARRIRCAISDAFESAMIPSQTTEEKKRLLHFVIVGGGPTGVEFAAELSDFVHEDLQDYFPHLVSNDVKITLIQSLDHILSTMDKRISEYTEKHFRRENIDVIINTRVKEVKQREVVIQSKNSDELKSISCSVVIWATGIQARPLTNQIREIIGLNIQNNRMSLLTDHYLRVIGVTDRSIFALGDCATIAQRKLIDQIHSLFEEADTEHKNGLNLQQFQTLVEKKIKEFPQLEMFSKSIEKAFFEADKEKSGHLTLDTLRSILEKADKKLRALPATAQVAYQQGLYIADLLNQHPNLQLNNNEQENVKPFEYKHKGSLAYVGGNAAVLDFTDSRPFLNIFNLKPLSGRAVTYLWKSYYFTEMFTGRTKTLVVFDWLRVQLYGRDISRY